MPVAPSGHAHQSHLQILPRVLWGAQPLSPIENHWLGGNLEKTPAGLQGWAPWGGSGAAWPRFPQFGERPAAISFQDLVARLTWRRDIFFSSCPSASSALTAFSLLPQLPCFSHREPLLGLLLTAGTERRRPEAERVQEGCCCHSLEGREGELSPVPGAAFHTHRALLSPIFPLKKWLFWNEL